MKLVTIISTESCQTKLALAADQEHYALSLSGYRGSLPILFRIKGNRFRLQKRRYYRNSFAPFFYGQFVASNHLTKIEGSFKMHPLAKWAITIWCAVPISIALFALAAAITGSQASSAKLAYTIQFTSCMLLLGVGMVMFGRWLGRSEEKDMIDFLKSTFDAHEST